MLIKISIILIFLTSANLFAQQKDSANTFNCDSLAYLYRIDLVVSKLPSPLESFAKVQNDFLKIADKSNFENTIYIEVIVDTMGNAHCPRFIKGTDSRNDTLAIKYIQKLNYSAAEARGVKIICAFTIYLLGEKVKETTNLIRKNGVWYDKVKNGN